MKRKIVCFVMMCMIMMFAGCSSAGDEKSSAPAELQETIADDMNQTAEAKQKEEGTEKADVKKDDSKAEETADEDNKEETKQVSLNVENDTFTFDSLLQQIGADEEDAVKVLGAKEKSDSYTTELFGETVVITLNSSEKGIHEIQLVFDGTDAELLTNAIAEQLGSDGDAGDKNVTWKLDNCIVKLQQTEKGCDVEISGKE